MKQVYAEAEKELGVWEWADGHNPKVVDYFAEVGHSWVKDDETAWCAAFVGAMLKRAGLPHTGKLNARSYLGWGEDIAVEDAQLGDVVVFSRGNPNGWKGHVAFLHGFTDRGDLLVLGGNQGNQVNIKSYSRSRLLGIRRIEKTETTPTEETPAPAPWAAFVQSIMRLFR
jgi:uncharacterized protein (TIGR02594 family)